MALNVLPTDISPDRVDKCAIDRRTLDRNGSDTVSGFVYTPCANLFQRKFFIGFTQCIVQSKVYPNVESDCNDSLGRKLCVKCIIKVIMQCECQNGDVKSFVNFRALQLYRPTADGVL